ncbi:MAG: hypothetical protein ACK44W_11670 [Planctomycetota bacterium]
MLLECSCGKMYRVRDDAAHPPTRCPACGGTLRVASSGPSAGVADARLKELEARLQALERDLAATRAAVELKDRELNEAHSSIARLGADLEKAQNAYKEALRKKDQELEENKKRLEELETRSAQAASGASSGELQRAQARIAQLEKIIQDGEQRFRMLQEQAEKAAREHAAQLEARGRTEGELRARIEDLERQLASAPKGESVAAPQEAARLGEARYLAADLDKSLASVGSALQALVERVRRLHESLNRAEAIAAPPATAVEPQPQPEPVADPIPAVSPPEASGEEGVAAMEIEPSGAAERDPLAEEARMEPVPTPSEAGDSPLEAEALSAETSPGPLPEEREAESESEPPPARKGLFGKLFGKKK